LQVLSQESGFRRTHRNFQPKFVNVEFADCPVETSLDILGKKWATSIVRDVGFYGIDRFNMLLKSMPGIPSKVLLPGSNSSKRMGFSSEMSRELFHRELFIGH